MSSKFKDYVTSTAFNLTLSKPMIECLSQMHQWGSSWANLSTCHALENRGLVERVSEFSDLPEHLQHQLAPRVKLSDAGEALVPLLKIAGLYVYFEPREDAVILEPTIITRKE
jgi:hypothetical protein